MAGEVTSNGEWVQLRGDYGYDTLCTCKICNAIRDRNGIPQPTTAPTPSAGHHGYLKLLDEMRELHIRKSADYGTGTDPFANVRASAAFGVPAWVGTMVRANDKMIRIQSLITNGSLKNESVEDSLMDLAAYALIALTLRREEQAKGAA